MDDASPVLDAATCRRIRVTLDRVIPRDPMLPAFSPEDRRFESPTESSRRHARQHVGRIARTITPTASVQAAPAASRRPHSPAATNNGAGSRRSSTHGAARDGAAMGHYAPATHLTGHDAVAIARAKAAKLVVLQREPPRTLSELVVSLEAENESLRADFDDALVKLSAANASRAFYDRAVLHVFVGVVDLEIATRRMLMDAEATSRSSLGTFGELLRSLRHVHDAERARHAASLKAQMDQAEETRLKLMKRHMEALIVARYRPPTTSTAVMTEMSLMRLDAMVCDAVVDTASVDPRQRDVAAATGIAHVLDIVSAITAVNDRPCSIGTLVRPYLLSAGTSTMDSQCDIRAPTNDQELQCGEYKHTEPKGCQTDPFRRAEAAAMEARRHLSMMDAALDALLIVKGSLLDDCRAVIAKRRNRGSLCVTAGDFATAIDAAASSMVTRASNTTAYAKSVDPRALMLWAWTDDGGEPDACVAVAGSGGGGHDTQALEIPGDYVNPARQLNIVQATLRTVQASSRRLHFEVARQQSLVRAASADALMATEKAIALGRGVEAMMHQFERQTETIVALRAMFVDAASPDRDGNSTGSPTPRKRPSPKRAATLETLADAATPAAAGRARDNSPPVAEEVARHSVMRSERLASPTPVRGDADDAASDRVGPSPRGHGSPWSGGSSKNILLWPRPPKLSRWPPTTWHTSSSRAAATRRLLSGRKSQDARSTWRLTRCARSR
jgi:hypothetical protein